MVVAGSVNFLMEEKEVLALDWNFYSRSRQQDRLGHSGTRPYYLLAFESAGR